MLGAGCRVDGGPVPTRVPSPWNHPAHVAGVASTTSASRMPAITWGRVGSGEDCGSGGVGDDGSVGTVARHASRRRGSRPCRVFAVPTSTLARIVEPTSKVDAARVLGEVGVEPTSYATVKLRLPVYAKPSWRHARARASAAHAGGGGCLFDVSI